MDLDSSEDENLDLLKEAADVQFINDDMFKQKSNGTKKEENKDVPKSLRRSKDEDEEYNLFRVTPEFRKHVAKHLQKILDRHLENMIQNVKEDTTLPVKTKKRKKCGIKLLRSSEKYLKINDRNSLNKTENVNFEKTERYKKLRVNVSEEEFKNIAVDPEDILNKTDVKHWSNRSKAPVFKYKKAKNGKLVSMDKN